jgi:peptidoglycan/LPS O-acetylase OafA/YrhL
MKQLDGLRAFAVLFTMVTHFTRSQEGLLGLIPWGQMGVRLFFVLSGFLITGILLRLRPAENRREALRVFYCRRFLRIFPLYYATVAVSALVNIRPVRQTLWWHLIYLSNLYAIIRVRPDSVVTHFWSLAVEEQFYLIWPCLMLFLPRRHLFKAMVAAVCIGPLSRLIGMLMHVNAVGALPFACLDTLGMGAILAYLWDKQLGNADAARRFDRIALWVGLPSFAMFVTAQAIHLQWLGVLVLSDLALAFAFVWLVSRAASSFSGPVGALLESKPINYVGKISYGIYVLHAFMPVILFYALKWIGISWPDSSLYRFVVLVAMSIAAAAVSWHFFENRINTYKRHFEYPRPRSLSATLNDRTVDRRFTKALLPIAGTQE